MNVILSNDFAYWGIQISLIWIEIIWKRHCRQFVFPPLSVSSGTILKLLQMSFLDVSVLFMQCWSGHDHPSLYCNPSHSCIIVPWTVPWIVSCIINCSHSDTMNHPHHVVIVVIVVLLILLKIWGGRLTPVTHTDRQLCVKAQLAGICYNMNKCEKRGSDSNKGFAYFMDSEYLILVGGPYKRGLVGVWMPWLAWTWLPWLASTWLPWLPWLAWTFPKLTWFPVLHPHDGIGRPSGPVV